MCGGPNVCEPLKEALDTVAWLNLSNQVSMEWLALEAQGAYVKAVGLVAGLLQDEKQARKDTTLAANYLFGLFEVRIVIRAAFEILRVDNYNSKSPDSNIQAVIGLFIATCQAAPLYFDFAEQINSTQRWGGVCSV